jgi:hypothetical protein
MACRLLQLGSHRDGTGTAGSKTCGRRSATERPVELRARTRFHLDHRQPRKRASAAELRGAPDDTLLNQVLEPVNRVEYRRELRYSNPAGTP